MAHTDDPQEHVQQEAIDDLVTDFQKRGMSRRAFIQRSMALGLSLSAASTLLAACGGSSGSGNDNPKTLSLLTTWGGEEQARHGHAGRPPAAVAQGPGPRLGNRRIWHASARHLGTHTARGQRRQAGRPHR